MTIRKLIISILPESDVISYLLSIIICFTTLKMRTKSTFRRRKKPLERNDDVKKCMKKEEEKKNPF
jgi:hypothetical protein